MFVTKKYVWYSGVGVMERKQAMTYTCNRCGDAFHMLIKH